MASSRWPRRSASSTGYRPDGTIDLDPDAQVQGALRLVFEPSCRRHLGRSRYPPYPFLKLQYPIGSCTLLKARAQVACRQALLILL